MKKENINFRTFEALVVIDGEYTVKVKAKTTGEALDKIFNLPIFEQLRTATDADVNIDVMDIWEVEER